MNLTTSTHSDKQPLQTSLLLPSAPPPQSSKTHTHRLQETSEEAGISSRGDAEQRGPEEIQWIRAIILFTFRNFSAGARSVRTVSRGSLNNFIGFGLFCSGSAGFNLAKNVNKHCKVLEVRAGVKLKVLKTLGTHKEILSESSFLQRKKQIAQITQELSHTFSLTHKL